MSPEWAFTLISSSRTFLFLQALTIARKMLLFLTFSQRLVLSFFRLSDIAAIAHKLSVRISTILSFGTIKTAIRHAASSAQVDENHFSNLPL